MAKQNDLAALLQEKKAAKKRAPLYASPAPTPKEIRGEDFTDSEDEDDGAVVPQAIYEELQKKKYSRAQRKTKEMEDGLQHLKTK